MAGEGGDAASSADARARAVEEQMTDDERFSLLVSVMGVNDVVTVRDERIPEGVPMSAGYVPGVPRLGIPRLLMSDASLGVTNPGYREGDTATALPAGIALGASFNPELARQSGGMLGREARTRGLNVQLAGGINLARDPRNGRNFEYLSEDPLLSAVMAAESISGIQAEGVISTIKHYPLNCNETNRHWLDAIIDPAAHPESDLLAFEIAIERAQPGSVMTGYNKINGEYAGGNSVLIQGVLKGAWGYPGWVMSDWGGTPGWEAALMGLDQESGLQLDRWRFGDISGTRPAEAIIWSVDRPAGSSGGSRVSAPVEVPEDIAERIRTLCLALPEVTVRVDGSLTRTRSTAQSFDIRRRSFCLLVAREGPAGKPVPLLVLRADPDERDALLSMGLPFFASRAGRDRIVVVLTGDTDWEEIRELVTESYRILAPKKLAALLD